MAHQPAPKRSKDTDTDRPPVTSLRQYEVESRGLVEELLASNLALEKAKQAAEKADAAKTEFLSRMSHELRTPLNAVLGFAQLLQMQFDDPLVTESTDSIIKAGKHLLELVNEVLELSKIESARLSVTLEPVNLLDSVNHAVDLLRPLAATAGVAIEVDPGGATDEFVRADRQRLLQVLINLLNNAVKYNHRGGTVRVKMGGTVGDFRRVEIRDSGPGISESDALTLFQPFQRFGDTTVEGTGLGLALTKRFVDLMEGAVFLSDSGDEGSTFALELHKADAPFVPAGVSVRERVTTYKKDARQGTVLCIEDSQSNMRLVELLFEQWPSVKLIPVMQGLVGLEMARNHHPDLILLDLHLPDVQGERILWRLKNDEATASIPVVVITADMSASQNEFMMSSKPDEYLTKPIDLQELVASVHRHLRWGKSA